MITVHIVDDHKILVEGLQKLVDNSGFAQTTAVSYTGEDCLWKLSFKQPHVILLDINLPDWSGIDLCSVISAGENSSAHQLFGIFYRAANA